MTINGTNIPSQSLRWPANPADQLMSSRQWTQVADILQLTPREQQVAELLFNGRTRSEIGLELGMKLRTVRHHMELLHSKLQVTSRVGVVLRVISIRDQLCEMQQL